MSRRTLVGVCSVVLVLAVALFAVACGGGTTTTTVAAGGGTETTAAVSTDTTAGGAPAETIKIGALYPTTGDLA